jgi:endonuclease III
MSNTNDLSVNLLQTCDSEGQDRIKDELRQMEREWNEVENLSKTISENLEDCIATWNVFANKSEEIDKVLAAFKHRFAVFENVGEFPSEDSIESAKVNFSFSFYFFPKNVTNKNFFFFV